jgi:hypothetical protein
MQDAADLLHAIAALAWPLLVLTLFIVYKPEVRRLLARLRRGKVLGQDFEFALDRLEATLDDAELLSGDEVAALPPPQPAPAGPPTVTPPADEAIDFEYEELPNGGEEPSGQRRSSFAPLARLTDPEPAILDEAAVSPKLALIKLSGELERACRRLLAALSEPPEAWQGQTLPRLASRLPVQAGIRNAIRQFYDVRNKIVHGSDDEVDDHAALRALDSGLKILRTLRKLPVRAHVVRHPAVDVFADARGIARRATDAVVIENVAGEPSMQVFPTRRDYVEGQTVAWEWDFTTIWDESWYRDPDSGEIKYAWTSSAEFAGRPIEEVT